MKAAISLKVENKEDTELSSEGKANMRLRNRDLDVQGLDSEMQEIDSIHNTLEHESLTGEHRRDRSDKGNIILLVFLYVLQGIPLGLAGSMPMVLQNKGISYKQQAVFSFVFWPFSLKLLWAPIVDSIYLKSFGRRKTWLVPTQYLIGLFMLALSLVSGYLVI